MSAVLALKAARDAGVRLQTDGEGLILEAAEAPPAPGTRVARRFRKKRGV
jgi:hypothetical protein